MDFPHTYSGVPAAQLAPKDIPDDALPSEIVRTAQIQYELAIQGTRDHGNGINHQHMAERFGFFLGDGENLLPLIEEARMRAHNRSAECGAFMDILDSLMAKTHPKSESTYIPAIYLAARGSNAPLARYTALPEGYMATRSGGQNTVRTTVEPAAAANL